MAFQVKRVYEAAVSEDGYRVLVDRIWPRGLTKEKANIDLWLKDIAPSTAIRQWFKHDPHKWTEFQKRYFLELKQHKDYVALLRQRAKAAKVTLLYAAKEEKYNNAVALKSYLESQ